MLKVSFVVINNFASSASWFVGNGASGFSGGGNSVLSKFIVTSLERYNEDTAITCCTRQKKDYH